MRNLILAVLLILIPQVAISDVLELDDVYIDYKVFSGETRSPYLWLPGLEGHSLQNELNLNIDTTFLEHFYFDNTIHSLNDGDYRLIGWNWRFGLHLTDWIDFGWWHFSEHYTDFTSPNGFPLQNAWQLKIYLYRSKLPRKGLF